MTNIHRFLLGGLIVLICLIGLSCSIDKEVYSAFARSPTPMKTKANTTPQITLSPTPPPQFQLLSPNSTALPYPTASVVKTKAIAFIARDSNNNCSLWVVNIDGSGERKLVDNIGKWSTTINFFLRWSPDGKWISYISYDEMWIVSPTGANKIKVLDSFDKDKRLFSYQWAPDGSSIAYTQITLLDEKFDSESVRILNLRTGELHEIISTREPEPYGIVLRWSPNGEYLVFNQDTSFIVFDVINQKVKKEILANDAECSSRDNTAPHWSPSSEWLFHLHGAPVGYANSWICVSGLDGSNREIHVAGTVSTPVWDKTGNFLYFVARKTNPDSDPDLEIDEWLMKYDVRTQKTERLLSLRVVQTYGYIGQVSISPDGNTLVIQTQDSENQVSYILIDLKTFSLEKFARETFCLWSMDSDGFICLQESNGYSVFYNLNVETGVMNIISGEHTVEFWAISPVTTSP